MDVFSQVNCVHGLMHESLMGFTRHSEAAHIQTSRAEAFHVVDRQTLFILEPFYLCVITLSPSSTLPSSSPHP